jgi:glycosyltransferase involved in cell wall biosynthesis
VAVSVVVAAHNAGRSLGRCLDALARQGLEDAEVIVASSSTDDSDAIVRERFPFVRHLRFEEPLTVPELRGRAIAAARGAIIAVLDPYSVVDDGWLAALRRAHEERPESAIGGPVDLADAGRRGLLEWALYINEYGMFLPPMRSGPVDILPGANVSYKRAALFDGERPRHAAFWKTLANQEAGALWLAAGAVVALDKPIPFGDFLRTRYHHGRCFAGMRGGTLGERILRAFTAPLLPAVFLWRWGRAYLGRGRHRGKLFLTLPLQVLLFAVWSWGELVGYVLGTGASCRQLHY